MRDRVGWKLESWLEEILYRDENVLRTYISIEQYSDNKKVLLTNVSFSALRL